MSNFGELSTKNKIIVIAVGVAALAVIIYVVSAIVGGSEKVEQLTEPTLSVDYDALGFYPTVTVQVQNVTNNTITVQMRCTIYAIDGSVTDNISSNIVRLAPHEKTTLTAQSIIAIDASLYAYKCASFGNLQYVYYKY